MAPFALFTFLSSLALGTTMTLMSHHWILAWIGLEINTLAIIPLMTSTPHPRAIEAATKYFLTQAAASAIIVFTALINTWAFGEWNISSTSSLSAISLTIAICMKLGLAPLHFWMPEVLQGIPLMTGLILSTWQKIAPMALLVQISNMTNLTLTTAIAITSIIIGGWGGINQTQLRKIMAFSSIGHLGWMIVILKMNPSLTLFNFFIYIIMTSAMFLTLIAMNTTKISQISTAWPKTPTLTTLSMLSILSLGGLPPLTGFAPKLLTSLELTKQNAFTLAGLILLLSLLALFFYIRLTYTMSMTMAPNSIISQTTWRSKLNKSPMVALTNLATIMLLPMTPTILLLF
uniref:NADH-ubiquinone oxidoreductase chain 2 n=1 Tax=Chiasmocleis ventrimaculata TaxID=886581 RepID=A0A343VTC0_9NEOB|nr:NADH dehydrogenase subunit 2 [Chiasmocleis ventrimaculata]